MQIWGWVPSYIGQFYGTVRDHGFTALFSNVGDVNIFSWPGFDLGKAFGDYKLLGEAKAERERSLYTKVLIGAGLIFIIVTKWKPR